MKDPHLNMLYKTNSNNICLICQKWIRCVRKIGVFYCGTVRIKMVPKVYLSINMALLSGDSLKYFECHFVRNYGCLSIAPKVASKICVCVCVWFTDSTRQLENVYYVYSISRNEHGKRHKKRNWKWIGIYETLGMKFISVERVTFESE